MARSKAGAGGTLDFERPIAALDEELAELRQAQETGKEVSKELRGVEERKAALTREIFSQLTPWQRVQVARHPNRPHVGDYLASMFTDVMELHGDRYFRDDPAIVTALARMGGRRVMVVGHRKGSDVKEKVACHFGSPEPEGYRKALRKMRLAERFRLPIVALIDTKGAYPDKDAEEHGQAWAIAENLQEMTGIRTPIVVAVVGEGGSGGALGIGVGDRIFMMENAYYSVISPEGCAAILWKSGEAAENNEKAAMQLKLTAADLERLGIIDEIVPEPLGGAHRNPEQAAASLKQAIVRALDELDGVPTEVLLEARYAKFRRMGAHMYAERQA